jgi:hypothetical protein
VGFEFDPLRIISDFDEHRLGPTCNLDGRLYIGASLVVLRERAAGFFRTGSDHGVPRQRCPGVWFAPGFGRALMGSGHERQRFDGFVGGVARLLWRSFPAWARGVSAPRHGQRRNGSVSANGVAWPLLVTAEEHLRESFEKLSRSRLTREGTETRSVSSAAGFFGTGRVGASGSGHPGKGWWGAWGSFVSLREAPVL